MIILARQLKTIFWFACVIFGITIFRFDAIADNGIDCGCSKTGSFIGPDQGAGVEISQDSISPNGKYRITVTGTGPYDIIVRRVSDNSLRYSLNLSNGHWGFSPDDDRFLYHYDLTGTHYVVLIDLSTSPAEVHNLASVATSSSRVLFSPFGDYVLYAALTSSTHTELSIFDARTGNAAYTVGFNFQTVIGSEESLGMVDWGFSPDSSSRTFVYAFITGQFSAQWQMINLQSRTKVLDLTLTGISSFWQFSSCGDVLGKVEQTSLSFMNVNLYHTISSQAPLYSQTMSIGDPIEFRTTASSHIVKVGVTDHVMSSNTADAVCTIEPISLKLNPRTVIGGFTSTGTVVLNNPAAAGGRVVTLSSSNTGVATVPTSITVPAGDTSGTFTVQTSSVASVAKAVISAAAGGVSKQDTLTVSPLSVESFTLSSGTVMGGDSVTATVTLTGSAGPGGKLVTLTNSNALLATVPTGITIPEGSQEKIFIVHTVPVIASDSVSISASAGGVVKFKILTILAFPSIRMQNDTVIGGNNATLIASLSAPAPVGGVLIQLQSSTDSIVHPSSPGDISAGQTEAMISVQTKGVGSGVTVNISAVNAPFPTSTSLHVVPANLSLFTSLTDYGCIVGEQEGFRKKFIAGKPILFSITLDGKTPPGGAHVNLSIDKPDVLTLLDSTSIPANRNQYSFGCISANSISSPVQVILTASYRSITLYDTITIVPALHYTFFAVHDDIDGFSIPVSLNNHGEALVAAPTRCYIWRDGVRTPSKCGRALNDSGWIINTEYLTYGRGTAVLYKQDTTIYIPHPDTNYSHSVAIAMNNNGDVAISSSDMVSNGRTKFTIWRNGAMLYPGSFDPYSFNVNDINDNGQAVGGLDGSGTGLPTPLSFFWDGTTISVFPLHDDYKWQPWAINNIGSVVGAYYQTVGTYRPSWFLLDHEVQSFMLPLPPWRRAIAQDINDSGVVVGSVDNLFGNFSAFIYKDGLTYDLNCLTTVPNGWKLSSASKINNAGDILGYWETSNGTLRSFLLRPGTVTDVKEHPGHERALPTSYILAQNYPNPFNPSTTFSYQLPSQSRVTLEIFNTLGQKVAQLVHEQQEAGYYEQSWNAFNSASGVYFYRLNAVSISGPAKSFTQVKKMMLVK